MSDRTTAWNFGRVFTYLAKQPCDVERDEFAAWWWEASGDYDFYPYQLECDEALVELKLARTDLEGETLYYGEPEWDQ